MADLISRQAAIRWVKTECNPYGKPTLDFETGKKVIEHLKQMPSAQPEIIHCRDCKHWKTDHPTANGYHCCHRIHNAFPMREDDFCSRAEKREK